MAEQATDPFQAWRDWMSESERQWNSFLNDAMATDQFSQGMGQFMDVYLNTQKTLNDTFGRFLSAFNLPTRTDVLDLANRLTHIEDRLGAIESGLAASARANRSESSASPVAERDRPARTKQPA
jgi:polyhydroxyalkanoic acid synthase PhaR subunit